MLRRFPGFLLILLALGQTACHSARLLPSADSPIAWVASSNQTERLARYAPIFARETPDDPHDYIGTVAARRTNGRPELFVDPSHPTLYAEEVPFETEVGSYTNLIYRIHFSRIPLPHLTAGKNVGLLVIITLNEHDEPVLLTTAHTCGCYFAVIPTTYLPADHRPLDWSVADQDIFGETLPGLLRYPTEFDASLRPVVFLRDGENRIAGVHLESRDETAERYTVMPTSILPLDALEAVPYGARAVSFFEIGGPRKGYVKGAFKPLERLLMSWWALDLHVGHDKIYTDRPDAGVTFYTSLKIWNRKASDLARFAECLRFWGWRI